MSVQRLAGLAGVTRRYELATGSARRIEPDRQLASVAECFSSEETKVNFEVAGQAYFLNFSDQYGQWFVIKPTTTGVVALPVYVDQKEFETAGFTSEAGTSIPN
ncbi:MAG: hypothetical protein H0X25_06435 [Acidobacteriales bacterium]|nr:hypothetical protein [Terriglobales bacterium]